MGVPSGTGQQFNNFVAKQVSKGLSPNQAKNVAAYQGALAPKRKGKKKVVKKLSGFTN